MPAHIDIEGEASIVIVRKILATPFSFRPFGRASIGGQGRHARLLLLAWLALTAPASADEDKEPPPDPLTPPVELAPNQRGYFGGGSVPPSLLKSSGVRVGDFALGGQASLGLLYDDNVEADDEARDEDVFLTFSPSVRAQSTYARHSIGIGAGATMGTALEDSGDDFFDWRVGADGRFDLSRRRKINASVGYSRDVEDDESIDAEDDQGDTPIHSFDARLGYDADGERLGFGVDGTLSRLDIEGDDFEDWDRTSLGLNGRIRYRYSEDLTFSAGPNYRRSTYDEDVADDGAGRDADEYGLQVGAGYRASRTIRTRASLGYALVDFEDSERDDDDRMTGSAGLTWGPGHGVTLDLLASRTLGLSIVNDEDARTSTKGAATLAHRLKLGSRSALTSSLTFGVNRLSDLDRTDKNLAAGVTYAYRLAEYAFFTSSYRFSLRNSDDEDADYYRNLISIGVTVSY
ncbi:MAG: outer membrane beta-barrel protein [Alphaproteobacteria bacterium]|nr:outer membrane beta-barrel protein [Alphaproteobacteria bacterium]